MSKSALTEIGKICFLLFLYVKSSNFAAFFSYFILEEMTSFTLHPPNTHTHKIMLLASMVSKHTRAERHGWLWGLALS